MDEWLLNEWVNDVWMNEINFAFVADIWNRGKFTKFSANLTRLEYSKLLSFVASLIKGKKCAATDARKARQYSQSISALDRFLC